MQQMKLSQGYIIQTLVIWNDAPCVSATQAPNNSYELAGKKHHVYLKLNTESKKQKIYIHDYIRG